MVTPTPTPPPQIKKEKERSGGDDDDSEERLLRDLSLSTKAIREEKKRKRVEMKMQVLQTLTEATLLRLGGQKAIFQMNKGLIHVLELIEKAPGGRISTRELLRTINSTAMHKYLKEAELSGFIKRELEQMPPGQKGGRMMVNSLTEEGRVLLEMAGEYSSAKEGRR